MAQEITIPLWLFAIILLFAAITFASHFLFPSVRWFFRRRLERAVARLNQRLERPIQPFKLARRHDTIQRLIYDPQVGRAVQAHARREGIPEAVAFEQAKRYAREIVPSFSAFAYFGLAIRVARFLSNMFYEVRLNHTAPEEVHGIDPDATVVFVMNHRSNMDYVLVTYLAARQSALSYAVGEWARVWPLSRLIRAMGAYFIRRKSRNDLYRHVLSCYVRQATEAGVTQAIFPEGGLSLSGGLGPPKLGLLKYMIAGATNENRDVVFVPVALNYDRVLEDSILTDAASRPDRRFRARIGVVTRWMLKQLWQRLRGRSHQFGLAAVQFGVPLSLDRFRAETGSDFINPLADELMARIGQVVPILPVPAIAWMLTRHQSLTPDEIEAQYRRLSGAAEGGDTSAFVTAALRQLQGRGLVEMSGDTVRASGDRPQLLQYYAASISHLLPGDAAGAKENSAPAGS
ncbi:glycerol-3-phosphate acyltransferase [Cribrihabitans marinus]|uniref:Glycerol-3-phosphate acyltransferase n=1 Tax=Cribrihabitans marinus TaxID=1227549 RepID=A0A1H7CPY4_9RHOB|nr:1-acyl-sn-glycerol-3-phosphate acyltransferase [Cribrihabitans marinus]GGH35478.1 glycerol-3-phosphate 1-O-acyltransferase [Cribrihabitans marinus]SEJ88780.1 glycerol-3-phosphate acyltransferase [Cribrihabitans marinus]